MNIFNLISEFFAPVWSSNLKESKDAIDKITSEKYLLKIALSDHFIDTRHLAVKKITNEEILLKIVLSERYDKMYSCGKNY